MNLSIVLRGLELPLRGMAQSGRIIEEEVEDGVLAELGDIATDLADYPSPRPGQRYERTGDLGQAWMNAEPKFVAQGSSIGAGLSNPTPYAGWVQGEDQVWVHQGRWPTTQEMLREHEPSFNRAMTDAMQRAAERMVNGG